MTFTLPEDSAKIFFIDVHAPFTLTKEHNDNLYQK